MPTKQQQQGGRMPMKSRIKIGRKIRYVEEITEETTREVNPVSLRQACFARKIQTVQFHRWRHQLPSLMEARKSKYQLHDGRPSSISEEHQNILLEWIIVKRENGSPVSYSMLERALGQLDPEFREKSSGAQKQVISRWAERNKFVYRIATHVAQADPNLVREEARRFVAQTVPRLARSLHGRRCKDYIINMDETPVFFSFGSKKTLAQLGDRTINVVGSPRVGSTSRASCFLSVTASGKMLTPLVVFKGEVNGRIAQQEVPNYPRGAMYQMQVKAWCDRRVMLHWIDNVLGPYLQEAPPGVIPVLLLDKFSVHVMEEIAEHITGMSVEIIYIKEGCTSLAQPLDVGINKPFKDRIRKKWQEWVDQEKAIHGEAHIPKADRELVAQWIIDSNLHINENIGRNAWLHAPFNYFAIPE